MSVRHTHSYDDVIPLLALASEQHQVPGLAAAAVADGEVAHVAVHGWRDVERQAPMTADTPSRWYSISKALTAMALGRLVADGRLRWDQPVRELVPGLGFADPVSTERATVRDCLLHSTGLISGDWTWFGAPSDAAELLRRLPHVSCRPGFRAGHYYQNLNFTILGEVLTALGTDWHRAMRELLGSVGVRPITRLSEFVAADRALGYGPSGFSPALRVEDFDFEGIAPASAVCGSIADLAQVARAVAAGGKDLLPKKVWAELTRPVQAQGAPEWSELRQPCGAMAGRTIVYRGELVLQFAGGFRGYTSHLLAMPERKAAACAFVNRGASPVSEMLAWSLLDRAVGWDPLPWADRFLDQKRRQRRAGEQRLAGRLARPAAAWPIPAQGACGGFVHEGYGELVVAGSASGPRLQFRNADLPLMPRPDGSVSADGGTVDFPELCWDLFPEIDGDQVVAWRFGPDDASDPSRFLRVR